MTHQRRAGFTIVELLVVISIIAVLVSLLLPALSKAREGALHLQCQSLLRGHGIAMTAYAADSKDFYPYSYVKSSNGGNSSAFPISDHNSHTAFQQYYTYLQNMRTMFCPTFNMFYWIDGIDKPYQAQKSWSLDNDFALTYGYAKYCGTAGWTANKPLYTERYADLSFTSRDNHDEDPPWMTWSYNMGYQRVRDADASTTTTGGKLGASGIALWSDYNSLDGTYTSATAHNAAAPFKTWFVNSVNSVTGLNEVMGDGHARWYSVGNSSDGVAYTFDGQEGSWYVQTGY